MATITGTHVNFIKVNTLSLFNDLTKVDGTIYFIVSEKKIYLDGEFYGFNDGDIFGQFLELTGGQMDGDIYMSGNAIHGVDGLDVIGGEIQLSIGGLDHISFLNNDGNLEIIFDGEQEGHYIFERNKLDLNGKTIDNLTNATLTHQAINLGQLQGEVLNKRGIANGFATLDGAGLVPANQLPSYVDDVVMYATEAQFPSTGEDGKIYVAEDTNRQYRWTGSAYTELYAGVVLGETASTAYRGDRGKTAYDHTFLTDNPHSVTKAQVGLGSVQNYGLASEAQAKAGTVNTVYMTPLRTKEAIEELAPKLSWTVVA